MARNPDQQKTEVYSEMSWTHPVKVAGDLPDVADEGQLCYVQEESAVYAYRSGTWVKEIARKG